MSERKPFLPGEGPMLTREQSMAQVYLAIARGQAKADRRGYPAPVSTKKKAPPPPPPASEYHDPFQEARERLIQRALDKHDREFERRAAILEREFARKRAALSKQRAKAALREADRALSGTRFERKR